LETETKLLRNISGPQDVKKLSLKELKTLADEIRGIIVSTVSDNGGHLASNLGAVELSIALHRVFNSPQDKIVWDVGHQCYAHKLLTGRLDEFSALRREGGLSGFPKRSESRHDAFNTGHASTSISAALGLLTAEQIQGGKGRAVAVIGDGALTGGMAYEALSHAGHLGLPLIVILNDNKMSISPNVGGLSKYLSRLSMKTKYQTFRRHFDAMAKKIPFIGEAFYDLVLRLKRAVKAVFYIDNFFVDLGFEYVGPIGGHNIKVLIDVLNDVKKIKLPVVIHLITRKGKGYSFAEYDPDSYHGVSSFSVDNGIHQASELNAGEKDHSSSAGKKNPGSRNPPADEPVKKKYFSQCLSDILINAARKNKRVTAVTAAMKTGTGLSSFADSFPGRFFDVGIAEEHAVTFAAGLAANGMLPVVAVYSTFIQRSVDQVMHDAALQKLRVIFALDRAGFVSADGETHQGLFDISLFKSAPNITILAPACETEMNLMFEWAMNCEEPSGAECSSEGLSKTMTREGPVIIRYPKAYCPEETGAFRQPLETGRGVWVKKTGAHNETSGKKEVCLAFTGSLYNEAKEAAATLKGKDIETDLYNLRFLKPVDEDYLAAIMNEYRIVCFIEEGIREGGFAEYAASLSLRKNCASKVVILAVESGFLEEDNALGTREELLRKTGLDGKSIANKILKHLLLT